MSTETPSVSGQPTVLFAGGGTGGHIYPNLAIWERLRPSAGRASGGAGCAAVFVVSNRPLDAQMLGKQGLAFAATPARPLSMKPWTWLEFYKGFSDSRHLVAALIKQMNVKAVVATGGFVSGPALAAARAMGVPSALVNLDAVPGKANRWAARKATKLFTAYASPVLPGAELVGIPLRRNVIGPADKGAARQALGMDPQRETLFITAGSQGAATINRMVIELSKQNQMRKALADWQVLHLTGEKDRAEVEAAYAEAGLVAKVLPFCDTMGLAWAGASLAISRAGASSVAEVWANAVPTIFFPYPFHRDQHQKLNAEPMTRTGMAILMLDEIDPGINARKLGPRLIALMNNATQRYQMCEQMRGTRPADGAEVVAAWVRSLR